MLDLKSVLQLRSELLAKIRVFFAERKVQEVETPLLYPSTTPSPHISSFSIKKSIPLYLQTSPEFAMKRLLAAGSGDIYQICKAFRDGECGAFHNPEFTILEWYRINFTHLDLMNEVAELLSFILGLPSAERFTYAEIFEHHLQINPHRASIEQLKNCAIKNKVSTEYIASAADEDDESSKDTWLQLLLTHLIEDKLGQHSPTFIYDFPPSQAALAKIRHHENPPVASRFEVYVKGIELANGFHELIDANEQRERFEQELLQRQKLGLHCPPLDEKFLQALPQIPPCAGVALGIDRLLMLAANAKSLDQILFFSAKELGVD
jgi:lysyl-tRNA synthetase class 2